MHEREALKCIVILPYTYVSYRDTLFCIYCVVFRTTTLHMIDLFVTTRMLVVLALQKLKSWYFEFIKLNLTIKFKVLEKGRNIAIFLDPLGNEVEFSLKNLALIRNCLELGSLLFLRPSLRYSCLTWFKSYRKS